MQDTKIIKHHSLAKFLEQVEQYINDGYSILLNDIKTYPKQVAGMFFATMTKVSKPDSEQEDEPNTPVEVGVGSLQKSPDDSVSPDLPEVQIGGMPESDAVAVDDPAPSEPEKVVPKRRTKSV